MSTITTRAGKGSPLTNNEVDANFTNLNTDKAELSGAAFTGAITTTSTVDGRDVATDGTKLDGIEAGADVTDTTNVTAAGALMDSELTSIASVKALDQGVATTDSPQFVGITSTSNVIVGGNLTVNGTTTTLNTATLDVEDKNITINYGAGDTTGSANGAGITIQDAVDVSTDATILWDTTNDEFDFSHPINVAGKVTSTGTSVFASLDISGDIDVDGTTNLDVVDIDGAVDFASTTAHAGNATFADNAKAIFGAGSDLQIYHNGTQNYIEDAGTGNLNFKSNGNNFNFLDGSDNVVMQIDIDSETTLYHNTSAKLATASTGIDVTGNLTMASGGSIVAGGANDLILNAGESGTPDIYLQSGGSTKVKIEGSNGNVGIGTSLPQRPLHVNGTEGVARFTSTASGNNGFEVGIGTSSQAFLWQAENAYMQFATNNAERARLDSSGNLLVGTTSTIPFLLTSGTGAGITSGGTIMAGATAEAGLFNRVGSDGAIIQLYKAGGIVGSIKADAGSIGIGSGDCGLLFYDAGNRIIPRNNTSTSDASLDLGATTDRFKDLYLSGIANIGTYLRFGGASNYYVHSDNANYLRFGTAGSERMRIDSAGNLLVGTTSQTAQLTVNNGGNNYPSWLQNSSSSVDYPNRVISSYATGGQTATMFLFLAANGDMVGSVKSTVTATTYNTSSDQRLKENIADADDAGSKIDAIQVRQYDWKVDGSHQDYGMVAQELQLVAPEAVSGDADSEDMMGVDYSKLVPMLIKEIQSLRNRVAQLEE